MNIIKRNAVPIICVMTMVMAFTFFLALFLPVDVLKDWSLTLDKTSYSTGDTVVLTSTFKKVKNVTGISKRYIVCKTPTGSENRIPMSEASANRATSDIRRSDIYLRIPTDIPSLPAKCHIEISIDYTIYSFRTFNEQNRTPDFIVNQKTPPVTEIITPDNDNEVVENSPTQDGNASIFIPPNETAPNDSQEDSGIVPPPSYLGCVTGQTGLLRIVTGIVKCL